MTLFHIVIQIVFSYLGTFAFGLFINLPKSALNISSLIAVGGWLLCWIMFKLGIGSILPNFCAAFVVGLLGLIAARKKRMPSTMFVSGLVPLVPGASGYQAISAFVDHTTAIAVTKLVHVAMLAGAIALGYILSQLVNELIFEYKKRKLIK